MARRSTPEERSASLCRSECEQLAEPACDPTTLAALKQIIENHVAALEILHIIESQTPRMVTQCSQRLQ
jgi:hypothetical protein